MTEVAEKVVVRSLRELDALVAEHVMGIYPLVATAWANYSTSIADAWQVVEHIRNLTDDSGYLLWIKNSPGGNYKVEIVAFVRRPLYKEIMEKPFGDVIAATAPIAICLAALRSKGIDVQLELSDAD